MRYEPRFKGQAACRVRKKGASARDSPCQKRRSQKVQNKNHYDDRRGETTLPVAQHSSAAARIIRGVFAEGKKYLRRVYRQNRTVRHRRSLA